MKSNETSTLTEQQAQSLALVQSYFESMQRADIETVEGLFADDVVEIAPLSATGGLEPSAVFEGKEAVMSYQRMILKNFSEIRFTRTDYTIGVTGDVVFFEGQGDFIGREGNKPYRNIYVFKFTLREGKIAHIAEYANPVTFAKLMGMPVG